VEWLALEDAQASDWTRDPLSGAGSFLTTMSRRGFERASECADRLKAAPPELSIFIHAGPDAK
jgi:hypothetical protein